MFNRLTTDAYKVAMAQAGFPLRPETFYLSFRKGGWQYIPFDLEAAVMALLPGHPEAGEDAFLRGAGFGFTPAMREALSASVTVRAAPAGSWVNEREPILTITGPSFLVSWLEPLVLRLFFPIQLATALVTGTETPDMLRMTCEEQAQIARNVMEAVGIERPLTIEPDAYVASVQGVADALLAIIHDPSRIFEVGMRAATCEAQHKLVLQTLRDAGIVATSNMALANDLGMKPVGTMGHEHVQRWGNDLTAYLAMRDMRNGVPSYLLDTFDTITSGIPAAVQVMLEREHACAVRYDSGDKVAQYLFAHAEFSRNGLEPAHILEDGFTVAMTAQFEALRADTGLAPEKQLYGYGGLLVSRHWSNPLTRDRVAAVYKLTQTGGSPRMKFGNEQGLGKVSVPGFPTVWRRLSGSGPVGVIAQVGETIPAGYGDLHSRPGLSSVKPGGPAPYTLSPATQAMVKRLRK